MTKTITILLADDHPVVRDGLAAMLATEPDFHVVGMAATGAEAMRRVTELKPDIVLLDLEMPSGNGVEVIEHLRAEASPTKVIVFTAFDQDEQIMAAIRAGAQGYLLKGAPRQELFRAIRTVEAGGSLLEPAITTKLLRRIRDDGELLTAREREVLALLVPGHPNKVIARELSVSERTVKFHVGSILAKLGCGNRTQAVAAARQRGLI
ncbi:two component transcriptional regulator, LuxR family [Rhizobiales bacterium GAS113]|jgi:DNA-binding NarL/FixJ family response regulator|nr:two component transcriptional regulator, LuxR family [Rhizobiales bacterium GAS113]SEC35998.1 two component transcriptional regulator, LuxR family [Rhizobiales bacterium GAS188]